MDNNTGSFSALFGIFNKLSMQQRMLLVGIFAVSLVLLGFIIFVFNEPTYVKLYSNLAPDDASAVLEHLNSQKITYKIDDNGTTISVPKENVYELRFSLAAKGVPSSGVIGYEIFDNNTLGMSEFMQKLNFKRALEGELSRTIMQQTNVEAARVHIVFPEKSIFKEEQKEPTASVVLNLSPGAEISERNITAMTNLVASSVEGLKPSKVTILDSKGRMLTRNTDESEFSVATGRQYEIKNSVENYMAKKAQSILDNVLGYGNSVVKVNVDLDFKQVEKTISSYDPETQIAISEQSIKSESTGSTLSDTNAVITENTTTNYEISKTIERVIEGSGTINRVTVAAVINGIPKEITNGDVTETVIEPRDEEQLQQLEQIIRRAVGIDDTRNDEISIISIPFETQFVEQTPEIEKSPFDDLNKWSNFILIFVAIGASMFVLKGLLKRLKEEKIVIGTMGRGFHDNSFSDLSASLTTPSISPDSLLSSKESSSKLQGGKRKKQLLQVGDLEDEITDEAQEKKLQRDKITNYVSKKPSEAAKLINSWLREDEY
ncbi:MAG: flagellar basal-body MS-ring/collar protein FliF [Ignavibacteria bacterium]